MGDDNKYQHGKIYRIDIGDCYYYGSTIQTLPKRMQAHKRDMQIGQSRLYQAMRETADCEWNMSLVLDYPCDSREMLLEAENLFIAWNINNPRCLNQHYSYITPEEKATYHKNYRERRLTCECGCTVTAGNLATHRKSKKHQSRQKSVTAGHSQAG